MSMAGQQVAPAITIGRDLGPLGRWVRLGAGALSLSFGLGPLITGIGTDPEHGTAAYAGAVLTLAAVVLIAAYYLALYRLLGQLLFARANPWFGTTILLGSLGAFTAPFMPEPLRHGAGLYVGATLILTAVIRYGGCEVVALPTLLFRRRYVIYCPWNAVDLAERPILSGRLDLAARLATAAAVIIGVYFILGRDLLLRLGIPDPVPPAWALVLVAPAGLLGYRAWQARRLRDDAEPEETRATVRVLGLGAAILVVLALYFAELLPGLWELVMLAGLSYAIIRAVVTVVRRRRAGGAGGSAD